MTPGFLQQQPSHASGIVRSAPTQQQGARSEFQKTPKRTPRVLNEHKSFTPEPDHR